LIDPFGAAVILYERFFISCLERDGDCMPKWEIQVVCTSVFKSGESVSKAEFTKKWIEMIRRMKKSERMISSEPLTVNPPCAFGAEGERPSSERE